MRKNLCKQCNQQVEELNKFCPHCGTPVQKISDDLKNCIKCNHPNLPEVSFCENCGNNLKEHIPPPNPKSSSEPKSFQSAGNYSGILIKGKTSKSWHRFKYAIIIAVVVISIALIIWFQVDPDAGEKLKTFFGGLLVIAIFLFVIFKRNKKGKRRGGGRSFRGGNRNDDDRDDDDDDYDDDDDSDDDD